MKPMRVVATRYETRHVKASQQIFSTMRSERYGKDKIRYVGSISRQ